MATTCPNCGATVDPTDTFCPSCDHILDSSFLSGPQAGAAPVDVTPPHGSPVPEPAPAAAPAPAPAAAPAPADDAPRYRRPNEEPEIEEPIGVDDIMHGAINFFVSLSRPGRITVGAAMALTVLAFFPWVSAPGEGRIAGIMVGGWFAVAMSAAIVLLVWWRERKGGPQELAWAQLAITVIAAFFCIYRGFAPGYVLGADGEPTSTRYSASFVIFIALLAALGTTAGTVLSLGGNNDEHAAD